MRGVSIILIIVILVAGCIGSEEGQGDGATTDMDTGAKSVLANPLAWGLTECRAAVALFDVPAEAVAPHLPAGFEPASTPQGMIGSEIPNPSGEAGFGMEMFVCASGTGLDGTVAPLSYASYFAFAEPPEDKHDPQLTYEFVKWDTLVPDTQRRQALSSLGLPVVDGEATWESFEVAGPSFQLAGEVRMGDAVHRFEGTALAPNNQDLSFVEWMATPDGLVRWYSDVSVEQASAGTVTVDVAEGTLAAEILGAGPAEGNLLAGLWSFDGDLRTSGDS